MIKTKLKIIEKNLELINENLPNDGNEFKNLGLVKNGIYKKIEASILDVISICSIINSDLKLGVPSNRDDIIISLTENQILSAKMAKKVKEMKGFRNFLIHRYGNINDEVAFNDIKGGLNDFTLFKNEILAFLNRKSGEI